MIKSFFYLFVVSISVFIVSCSKGNGDSDGNNGNGGSGNNPSLSSFTVTIIERSYNNAIISWTASVATNTQDTVKYKVKLDGILKDSNLIRLTDTLIPLQFTSTYQGTVTAYTAGGLSQTATFTIESQQGRLYFSEFNNNTLTCDNIFFNGVASPVIWSKSSLTYNSSTPTISNDTVFHASGTTIFGKISAFNALNGNLLWNISTNYSIREGSSMTYYQGNLYASTDSGLIAYNSKNGNQLWRYRRPTPSQFPRTNPVIANNKIFSGTESNAPVIMGFNLANGNLIWERALSGQLSPTPVLTGNLMIFNAGSNTIALDQNTGSVLWQHNNIGSNTISPILSGNILIVCDDAGNTTGLNTSTGATIWSRYFDKEGATALAAANGMIFTSVRAYVGNNTLAKLTAIRASDGIVQWEYLTFFSSLRGLLFANNSIYGYDSGPYNKIWKFNAFAGNIEAAYSFTWLAKYSVIVNNVPYYNSENGNYR